jgi:hypothetical protein
MHELATKMSLDDAKRIAHFNLENSLIRVFRGQPGVPAALLAITIVVAKGAVRPDVRLERVSADSGQSCDLRAKLVNPTVAVLTLTSADLVSARCSHAIPFRSEVHAGKKLSSDDLVSRSVQAMALPLYVHWLSGCLLKQTLKNYVFALPYKNAVRTVGQGPLGSFSQYRGSHHE